MTYWRAKFEEPAECLDCGLKLEAENLIRSSLDAFADLSVDYDLFCPACESNEVNVHRPKEY